MRRPGFTPLFATLALVFLGVHSRTHAQAQQAPPVPLYTLIDIGTLGGTASVGNAINSIGDVVGDTLLPGGNQHGFMFKAGAIHDIPTLGGLNGHAAAINTSGQVTGWADVTAVSPQHAYLYSAGGGIKDLKQGAFSSGAGINRFGDVVGTGTQGFIFHSGTAISLHSSDPNLTYPQPVAISDTGIITGSAQLPIQSPYINRAAFIFTTGTASTSGTTQTSGSNPNFAYASGTTTSLGYLPSASPDFAAGGLAISNTGSIIVGSSKGFNPATARISGGTALLSYSHAFVVTSGSLTDLSLPLDNYFGNSSANAINNHGWITGFYTPAGLPGFDLTGTLQPRISGNHAFLYVSGTSFDLNKLIVPGGKSDFKTLASANGINDSGWITGYGITASGQAHAFLAIPYTRALGAIVAAQNDIVDQSGRYSALVGAGSPVIDQHGDVSFLATLSGPLPATTKSSAILLFTGSSNLEVVAATGATDPITFSDFTQISDPALSGSGVLSYLATATPGHGFVTTANATAAYVLRSGSLARAITTGTNDFGLFSSISALAVDDSGNVTFVAHNIKGGQQFAGVGLYTAQPSATNDYTPDLLSWHTNGLFSALVPLPFVSGQGRSVSNSTVGWFQGLPYIPGIVLNTLVSGDIITIGAHIDSLPGVIATMREPAVNDNGTAAFLLSLSGNGVNSRNNRAIGVVDSSLDASFIETGDLAPDAQGNTSTSGSFTSLSDPILNANDNIAFIGSTLNVISSGSTSITSKATGIWSDSSGTLRQVAAQGDDAPGSTGQFASFPQIVLPNVRGVAFLANLTGVPVAQNQGIWVTQSNGDLLPVAKKGDTLDYHGTPKTIASISIFQGAPIVVGQSRGFDPATGALVYRAGFTDGTWAIYKVLFP